ncbi:Phosphoribosylformylglycinamidine synthase [Lactiplantibacillus plantarum subsp. plantarum]|uniref:Phosphoribosylformylglycinamidine synthase n=1 Tax=Lactiplantibacillus plantarum subsp. plantarum TaxID=337330 RepID=A0A2S3U1G3_LACPN|nr:Phosphoribosylformylglycinamidine synthase [Lactiplantibacillus plantarum subsp. plantarum]
MHCQAPNRLRQVYLSRTAHYEIANHETDFYQPLYGSTDQISLPIAHGEGNYYCDEATLAQLRANHQIIFEYVENPNGSTANIAGITMKREMCLG